ncbi:hypothetical protein [Actinomyces oris]
MSSSEMFGAIGCLALGGITLVNWGFAMFSDHWYADMVRYQSKTWFNLGRNTESVITPAAGLSFIFFGVGMLLYPVDADESAMGWLLGGGAAFFLFAAVLGLIPFRLPGPMYPEWQLERRRRRAQEAARANWEHEVDGVVPRGRHAAPPEMAADAGGQYGYEGDACGEDPLKSGDSLPERACSPRAGENSGGGPGDGANV